MNQNIHTAEVLSPRAMLFVGIVGLHVVFAYVLSKGLMPPIMQILNPEMQVIIPDDQPPPKPIERVIDEPKLQPAPPIVVPVPEGPIDIVEPVEPVFADAQGESLTEPVTQVVPPAIHAEAPIHLVGRNTFPNADSYYPPSDRRLEVEGTALVRACVDSNAKLDGTPVIETSSGSKSLDNAALRVAKDGRYARSMRGDTAVPNCHRFRVTFSLH